jgi:hypothetical protein
MSSNYIYEFFLCSLIFIMLSGIALADVLPQQPDEVQGLIIETSVISDGIFHQDSALQWDLSSEILGANIVLEGPPGQIPVPVIEPEPPLNPAGEVQMHCVYTEDTAGVNGQISFDKVSSLNTRALPSGDWNVQNDRLITFTGYDAGSVLSDESLNMDTAGTPIITAFSSICPFSPDLLGECIPSFCNQIGAGSGIDLDTFSLHTAANLRNVNAQGDPGFFPPIPTSDNPAKMQYLIEVTGYSSGIPASGSISTNAYAHIKEGGPDCPGATVLATEVDFEESRDMTGLTSLFSYEINYDSGISI